MSSKLATDVYDALKRMFPLNVILREHYVFYKGKRLFFDYFIKDLGVLIECQGQQHTKFVEHFHGDGGAFLEQKKRDNLKREYIQNSHELVLVRLYFNEEITDNLIYDKICKALEGGFYE